MLTRLAVLAPSLGRSARGGRTGSGPRHIGVEGEMRSSTRPARWILAAACAAVLTDCRDVASSNPVASVVVAPASAAVTVGDTVRITATATDAGGHPLTGAPVTWTSGNTRVAAVSSTGLVSGIATGVTTVTATSEGQSAAATITVSAGGTPQGVIASRPLTPPLSAIGERLVAGGAGDSVVYVSVPVGTLGADGAWPVENLRTGELFQASVVAGGFDPIPMYGGTGDTVIVGYGPAALTTIVPDAGPPVVVRTQPPKKKTDVPLNAALLVYFSEPLDSRSVTSSSIELLQGGAPVSGSVRFADSTHATVQFVPTGSLLAGSTYQLVAGTQVHGLDGEALATSDTTAFTTGTATTGPPVSLSMGFTAIQIVGVAYQMVAIARDSAGTVLSDQPITWTTSDPRGLSVTASGLLTALTEGFYGVEAHLNALTAFNDSIAVRGGPVATVVLTPTVGTVAAGDQLKVEALVRDAAGHRLNYPSVIWSTDAASIATVGSSWFSYYGTDSVAVTGVAPGGATITATSGVVSGTMTINVGPPRAVASVTVLPATDTVVTQTVFPLTASFVDANGQAIPQNVLSVTWVTDNPSVATVDNAGLVRAVAAGVAHIAVSSEGHSATATVTVQSISMAAVGAGGSHACGVTAAGAAYCWGNNNNGQLGNGEAFVSSTTPVAVNGGFAFVPGSLTLGGDHSCALTLAGSAYCWGSNGYGELGDSVDYQFSSAPDAVRGGLAFSVLSAGLSDTCGLTTSGQAYCWGDDAHGQVGDSDSVEVFVPVPVVGGFTFTAITVGGDHSCGLAVGGTAYCWGANDHGQLGDSGVVSSNPSPVLVAGGHVFTTLRAGLSHTCAIDSSGMAFCWGWNAFGQLGDGTFTDRLAPVPVAGGQGFTELVTGSGHTCGISAGTGVCWGWNGSGQLGNGTKSNSATPIGISGGIAFATLSAGTSTTCGLSVGGVAYCWGANASGALGNGTLKDSAVPVKVSGQP